MYFYAGVQIGVGHKRILVLDLSKTEDARSSVVAVGVTVHAHFATGDQVPKLRDVVLYDWSDTSVMACV